MTIYNQSTPLDSMLLYRIQIGGNERNACRHHYCDAVFAVSFRNSQVSVNCVFKLASFFLSLLHTDMLYSTVQNLIYRIIFRVYHKRERHRRRSNNATNNTVVVIYRVKLYATYTIFFIISLSYITHFKDFSFSFLSLLCLYISLCYI